MGIEIINTEFEKHIQKITIEREIKINEAKLEYTIETIDLRNKDIDDLVELLHSTRFEENDENKGELKPILNYIFDNLEELEALTRDKNRFEIAIESDKEVLLNLK